MSQKKRVNHHHDGISAKQRVTANAYINKRYQESVDQFERKREEYIETVISTYLLAEVMRGHTAEYCRKLYRDAIRIRVDGINFYRGKVGEVEIAETAHNAEDYGFRDELRKHGIDIKKWEDEVALFEKDGYRAVLFPGEDGYEEAYKRMKEEESA